MGFWKIAGKFLSKHSTKILAGVAIVAEAAGLYFAAKEGPKAKELLDQLPDDASAWDKVKTVTPVYLPAIGMFILSSGAIIGGCAVGEVRLAAMTNIAMLSQQALDRAEQKLLDVTKTEDTEKSSEAQVAHQQACQEVITGPADYSGDVEITKYGRDIFYDPLCHRKFTSSIKHIEEAVIKVNTEITGGLDMWASVNEWYDALGIEHAKLGGLVGWHIDRKLSIAFNPHKTEDGEIITDIVYYNLPVLANGEYAHEVHDCY